MTYTYASPLQENDVQVALIAPEDRITDLTSGIEDAASAYSFTFVNPEAIAISQATIRHAIIVDGWDDVELAYRTHKDLIDSCTSATLAISYKSTSAFLAASPIVNKLKVITGGKVNFLLPNTNENGQLIPRDEKIIDNAVCDSVRIKYIPECIKNHSISLSRQTSQYFEKMSRLYEVQKLYHRSSTDGFISIRNPEGGFFITSTKTDKINLDLGRVSRVLSYSSRTNVLSYSGEFLPSSDSVECATIYDLCPDINAILHVHASQQITRNSLHADKIAVPPMRYGEPNLGYKVVKSQDTVKFRNFLIMEDHGELFFSREATASDSFDEIFQNVKNALSKTGFFYD